MGTENMSTQELKEAFTNNAEQFDDLMVKMLTRTTELENTLNELISLKYIKDNQGKTADYLERQPKAWAQARAVSGNAKASRNNPVFVVGRYAILSNNDIACEAGPFNSYAEAKQHIGSFDSLIFRCAPPSAPIVVARWNGQLGSWEMLSA